MYTDASVMRFMWFVALYVLLALGALPATSLACQWACAPQPGRPAHHHAAPEQSTGASYSAGDRPDATSRVSADRPCDHAGTVLTALSPLTPKVFAPVAIPVAIAEFAYSMRPAVVPGSWTTHSPPGARSAPLSLRI